MGGNGQVVHTDRQALALQAGAASTWRMKRVRFLGDPACPWHTPESFCSSCPPWVNGNWRLKFEFRDGNVYVLDYEDYH